MEDKQARSEHTTRGAQPDLSPCLSDDRLYRALASTRRRRLLYVLLVEEESSVDKLATVLAGWEATETQTVTTSREHREVTLELYHVHLPCLDAAGLVTYTREQSTVRIEPLDDAVRDLICQSVETERQEQ